MANTNKAKKQQKSREKLDFKFQFHATKVPSSGWDKLYVGLESTETGKTTAKTAKSAVQNGTCRWPDTVIESAKLVHETRSNTYEAKHYKLLVATSSKRVLGEVTFNLADYVTASATPASLVLPLKSCSASTVLHVKVQCLTSSSEDVNRESEQAKDGGAGQPEGAEHAKDGHEETEQAEQAKDGHVSDDDSVSVTSSVNLLPVTPPGTVSAKEAKSLARSSSNVSEFSTPDTTPSASFNARLEQAARASPLRNGGAGERHENLHTLQAKLGEKDEQICSLMQEREVLQSEMEQLRVANQFYEDKQGGLMLKLDECGSVIQELKQLLDSEKDSRTELEMQVKKAEESNVILARTVKDVEDALAASGKQVEELSAANTTLRSSLEDRQTKLSETLQSREVELEELTYENVDLIYKLNMANKELSKFSNEPGYVGMDELEEKVREFRKHQDENNEKLAKLEVSCRELESLNSDLEARLKTSVDEVQSLRTELQASKNMHEMNIETLSSREQRLKARSDEIHEKYAMTFGLVADLEAELETVKKESSVNRSRKEAVEAEMSSLEMLKADLVYRLESLQSENAKLTTQAQKAESELADWQQELRSKSAKVTSLEARLLSAETSNSELESKLRDAEDGNAGTISRILELELELSTLRTAVDSFEAGKHDLESKVEDLEMDKCELEKQMRVEQEECRALKARLEGTMAELEALQVEVSSKEMKVAELSSSKHELQKQTRCLESDNWRLTERISGLENQLGHLTAEREVLLSTERRAVELETEKSRRETYIEELLKHHKVQVGDLEVEVAKTSEERDANMQARRCLEVQNENLKSEHAAFRALQEEAINELRHTNDRLEGCLRRARSEHEEARRSMEAKMYDLERDLGEAVARHTEECSRLSSLWREHEVRADRAEGLLLKVQSEKSSAVEGLQSELQRLSRQMDATCDEKEHLASQALIEASELRGEKLEWEEVRKDLQEKLSRAYTELEIAAKQGELRLQEVRDASKKRELDLQGRLEVTLAKLAELEDSRKCLADEYEATLESQRQRLLEENAELRAKVVETCQLKSESDACVEKLRAEKNELEATVQRLDALNARLQQEKASMEEKVQVLSLSLAEFDQMKVLKLELEEKVQSLMSELSSRDALETEQRIESMRLRKQNSDLRQKSLEHKEERDELRLKIETMEAELKKRAEALSLAEKKIKERGGDENGRAPSGHGVLARSISKSNMKVGVRENRELMDKVKALEGELKLKNVQTETLKKDALQKEMNLLKQIDALESASNDGTLADHQLKKLRNQVSVLTQRERELLYKLNSHELLQKEMQRIQQVNVQLQEKITKFKEASKAGNSLERVVQLETELAEALESNNMYKEQLRCAFASQQNVDSAALWNLGDIDQVVRDLLAYKRKTSELEDELTDFKERYSNMSLKFAEVEAEREELVMTIRNLRSTTPRRLFSM